MDLKLTTEIPDKKKVWELFLTTGWNAEYNLTEEEYYSSVTGSRFVVSAYANGVLAGYGRAAADGIVHAMIYDLIVHPDFQGKGIGSQILNRLIELCNEEKIRDIQLFSAKGKRDFYEKRGFLPRPADAPGMDYKPIKKQL